MPSRVSSWGGIVLMPSRRPLPSRLLGGAKKRRRRVGARKIRPVVYGRGIFSSIGNFVKNAVTRAVPAVIKSGVIGNLAGRVNPMLGTVVKAVGARRRRRVVRRRPAVGMARRRRRV